MGDLKTEYPLPKESTLDVFSACEMTNWCGQHCQKMDKKLR